MWDFITEKGTVKKNPSSNEVLVLIELKLFHYLWSHLSQNQGYISTDYQIVRHLRWFDNRTNLVRSSNQPKNHDFLTLT